MRIHAAPFILAGLLALSCEHPASVNRDNPNDLGAPDGNGGRSVRLEAIHTDLETGHLVFVVAHPEMPPAHVTVERLLSGSGWVPVGHFDGDEGEHINPNLVQYRFKQTATTSGSFRLLLSFSKPEILISTESLQPLEQTAARFFFTDSTVSVVVNGLRPVQTSITLHHSRSPAVELPFRHRKSATYTDTLTVSLPVETKQQVRRLLLRMYAEPYRNRMILPVLAAQFDLPQQPPEGLLSHTFLNESTSSLTIHREKVANHEIQIEVAPVPDRVPFPPQVLTIPAGSTAFSQLVTVPSSGIRFMYRYGANGLNSSPDTLVRFGPFSSQGFSAPPPGFTFRSDADSLRFPAGRHTGVPPNWYTFLFQDVTVFQNGAPAGSFSYRIPVVENRLQLRSLPVGPGLSYQIRWRSAGSPETALNLEPVVKSPSTVPLNAGREPLLRRNIAGDFAGLFSNLERTSLPFQVIQTATVPEWSWSSTVNDQRFFMQILRNGDGLFTGVPDLFTNTSHPAIRFQREGAVALKSVYGFETSDESIVSLFPGGRAELESRSGQITVFQLPFALTSVHPDFPYFLSHDHSHFFLVQSPDEGRIYRIRRTDGQVEASMPVPAEIRYTLQANRNGTVLAGNAFGRVRVCLSPFAPDASWLTLQAASINMVFDFTPDGTQLGVSWNSSVRMFRLPDLNSYDEIPLNRRIFQFVLLRGEPFRILALTESQYPKEGTHDLHIWPPAPERVMYVRQ